MKLPLMIFAAMMTFGSIANANWADYSDSELKHELVKARASYAIKCPVGTVLSMLSAAASHVPVASLFNNYIASLIVQSHGLQNYEKGIHDPYDSYTTRAMDHTSDVRMVGLEAGGVEVAAVYSAMEAGAAKLIGKKRNNTIKSDIAAVTSGTHDNMDYAIGKKSGCYEAIVKAREIKEELRLRKQPMDYSHSPGFPDRSQPNPDYGRR